MTGQSIFAKGDSIESIGLKIGADNADIAFDICYIDKLISPENTEYRGVPYELENHYIKLRLGSQCYQIYSSFKADGLDEDDIADLNSLAVELREDLAHELIDLYLAYNSQKTVT